MSLSLKCKETEKRGSTNLERKKVGAILSIPGDTGYSLGVSGPGSHRRRENLLQ